MILPDKCPFCSDPKAKTDEDGDNHYRCGSWASIQRGPFRSHRCKDAELARLAARVAELEAQNKGLQDRHSETTTGLNEAIAALKAITPLVAEMEERMKRLESASRAVYLDSIASDHPWTELETRNMHALRDVLEAKP